MEKAVNQVVRKILEQEFENIEILELTIEDDVDFDGDDVLRVKVVFDADRKRLDARKRAGLTRHVRPQLEKIGEMAFPIFSFIAASDVKGKGTATS